MTVISPFPSFLRTITWLSGWTYRKAITLSRASGAVTNYQMKLLVGESSGAVGEDVDCASHVATDFDDLRFTASDNVTLLDYWIESISGATPNQLATVWIEFNDIGTAATTFYMYYGNAAAVAYSNGANTFIVFDDFERGLDNAELGGAWTEVLGTIRIDTGKKWGGTRSGEWYGDGVNLWDQGTIPVTASDNIAIQLRVSKDYSSNSSIYVGHGNGTIMAYTWVDTSGTVRVYDGATWKDTTLDLSQTGVNSWEFMEWKNFRWASSLMDLQVISVYGGDATKTNIDISYTTDVYANILSLHLGQLYNPKAGRFDNLVVRNYRATAPAWGAWGVEETA